MSEGIFRVTPARAATRSFLYPAGSLPAVAQRAEPIDGEVWLEGAGGVRGGGEGGVEIGDGGMEHIAKAALDGVDEGVWGEEPS